MFKKFKGQLTKTAYCKRYTPYFYDRVFLFDRLRYISLDIFFINYYLVIPFNFIPQFEVRFNFIDLLKNNIYFTNNNGVILLYRLAWEALGFGCPFTFISQSKNGLFNVSFIKVPRSLSYLDCYVFSNLFKSLILVLDPLHTIQSFLIKVVSHKVGFSFISARLDFFKYFKWLGLVQTAATFLGTFKFRYRNNILYLLRKQIVKIDVFKILASAININPKFFGYLKLKQGLGFKIIYENNLSYKLLV